MSRPATAKREPAEQPAVVGCLLGLTCLPPAIGSTILVIVAVTSGRVVYPEDIRLDRSEGSSSLGWVGTAQPTVGEVGCADSHGPLVGGEERRTSQGRPLPGPGPSRLP